MGALVVGSLSAVPAVTAQDDEGDQQDTVEICHFDGENGYEAEQARETDFYGPEQQEHGEHEQDIVPPFTVENPRPGDPGSFGGRDWDLQATYDNGCEAPEPPAPGLPEPVKKVRICHSTSSRTNPYVSDEPAIANNGDLHGGHFEHTGPVFPADNWGDIIPPYTYVDTSGKVQTFLGYNWSPEGQAIWQKGCDIPQPPQPAPITPVLHCVEDTGSGLLAHFGYRNPNPTTVAPPKDENVFSPAPKNRGQPEAFASGPKDDAFQVDLKGETLTWTLTGNSVTASEGSARCQGSITVIKRLTPSDDTGLFALMIDGKVAGGAAAVGDGDTTGTISVSSGRHTVSESGAYDTELGDYTIETVCSNGASASGPSVQLIVERGQAVECIITNSA